MFVRDGLVLAAVGIALGLVAAGALTRVMTSLLFGVSALDPITFVAVAVVLAAAALLASYLPAHRATAVDPAEVLRSS
jgi:ABC-type antimicrobial peptide transport system permease subunit